MVTAYLALGSNLGDRLALLRAAVARLQEAGMRVVAKSPVFDTDAMTDEPQPAYLNAVVRVQTDMPAQALLAACLRIEEGLGRERPPGARRAPRTLDMDVLLYETQVIDEPGLRVPHPGLLVRAFVRVPLALVAEPGLRHPVTSLPLDVCDTSASVRPWPEGL